jgi:UDP-N-acetylglucosamine transferase subunit ALG13
MILLTVGTQLPFDRFVKIVDAAAPSLNMPIMAQIGKANYIPKHMDSKPFLRPIEFDVAFTKASLIVAHAGIGTIVMAQKLCKPIILFPRRGKLGEHRNDHQAATVNALQDRSGIYIARTEEELVGFLSRRLEPPTEDTEHPGREKLRKMLVSYILDNR